MREYILTSGRFEGQLYFAYDSEGVITKFEKSADLDAQQEQFMKRNFPFAEQDLQVLKGKQGKITEVTDLSFEKFWKEYGFKVGSKAKAEQIWRKLSESEKIEVFEHLPKYEYFLKTHQGIMKAYPTTFLNQRRWENEYK